MNPNNYCIIMAGGFGSRFWPMSKSDNPKQFVDVMGVGESMLQTTFHRFERICPRENIIIVTGRNYVEKVRQQLPGLLPYQVLAEPTRRNTAPCVARQICERPWMRECHRPGGRFLSCARHHTHAPQCATQFANSRQP